MARRFHLHQNTTFSSPKQRGIEPASWERTAQLLIFLIALTALLLHWAPQPAAGPELSRLKNPINAEQDRKLIGQSVSERSPGTNLSASSGNESQTSTLSEPAREKLLSAPIRMQVLNGCGIKGIARTLTPALRAKGFDVREVRNAKHFHYDVSSIVDRSGKPELAYAVADSLGIAHSQVTTESDPRLVDIDVTFIVGADFMRSELSIKSP